MAMTVGSKRVLVYHPLKGWCVEPCIIQVDGTSIKSIRMNPNAEQITAASHWYGDDLITPGFVDSHTHLALGFLRGRLESESIGANLVEDLFFKLEEKITAADVSAFTRMGAYESMLSGTTFVWDHYYHADAIADALIQVGLTGAVAATLQDLSGPGKNDWEAGLTFTQALHSSEYHSQLGISAALGPHATDTVSEDLWQKIIEVAEKNALPIHCHVAQSPEEFQRIQTNFGCTPVDYLRRLGVIDAKTEKLFVHMIYVGHKDLQFCKSDSVRLVACPHSQMIFHFPAAFLDWWTSGVNWGLGTDCAASNDSLRVQSELRTVANWPMTALSHSSEFSEFRKSASVVQAQGLAALRRAVLENSPSAVSLQSLLNIAFLGQSSARPVHPKVNGLTPGSYANLLIWNWDDPVFWPGHNPLHALVYSDVQPALKGVMTLGKSRGTVGDLRRSILCSSEYKAARREATERLNSLLDRAGL